MEKLDKEWLVLIMEAKKIGLSVEDIRNFLSGNHQSEQFVTYQNEKASYKN
ncbi:MULTISPECIES: anti-repressor SinI family protein [Neobacillus]|uniref:Anti-repressor SinI family protein n=2 Tax=Neobacillus rhizophilus TaxID=2833579 RepID=A0A942YV64_9BACI|nr:MULTISPECIES: anti-repressor SinI family protein [Neobacillus]MBS4213612.1 anti-repressor SinI family protein [Neobacillus rhizophilus]MBU8917981.1 anti-repressor SinI family protein [Bacillus sp. FJAT-29953]